MFLVRLVCPLFVSNLSCFLPCVCPQAAVTVTVIIVTTYIKNLIKIDGSSVNIVGGGGDWAHNAMERPEEWGSPLW